MARSAAKLKAIEDAAPVPSPSRQHLAVCLQRVDALSGEIEANATAQTEAYGQIGALESEIDQRRRDLANAPALSRRALRNEIAGHEETLQDYRDHLGQLRELAKTLTRDLDIARGDVRFKRADLLKDHPHVTGLLQRLQDLRGELFQVTSDISALQAVGGIPAGSEGWAAVSTVMPPPSANLATWLEALMADPAAEFAE
jgi:chromosome segregation ATPase